MRDRDDTGVAPRVGAWIETRCRRAVLIVFRVGYPLSELASEDPRAVLGSMDPSARIYFKPDILTFAAPWPKFLRMLDNMDDSFVQTDGWSKVKSRLKRNR